MRAQVSDYVFIKARKSIRESIGGALYPHRLQYNVVRGCQEEGLSQRSIRWASESLLYEAELGGFIVCEDCDF